MRSLTATQTAIIDSPVKTVSWLFNVTDKYLHTYYWSTKSISPYGTGVVWGDSIDWESAVEWTDGGDGAGYQFKIIDFNGITVSRPKTESGIMTPDELSFSVVNKDNEYNPDDFEGGYVKVILMVGNGVASETEVAIWKFMIKRISGSYQTLDFTCEDFFQQYLEGTYPSSQYLMTGEVVVWGSSIVWESGIVWTDGTSTSGQTYGVKTHDIFPNTTGVGDMSDYVCIPQPFGTCYVPIRPAYISTDWFYVIGSTTVNGSAITYSISKVRSPRDYSVKDEHSGTFTQSTKINSDGFSFRVFQAALDSAPVTGLYPSGDHYYDLPTQFTRSDTVTTTDFADVIKYVLLDIDIDASDIDNVTFAAAKAVFTGWGLTCNGAFWKVISREKAIVSLLTQCHSTLLTGEQLELHVLSSTSVKTLTSSDIIRPSETGIGTFRHTTLTRLLADCGNIRYSPTDDSQDVSVTSLVATKTLKRVIDETPLDLPFVQDGVVAKELARLHFQRKLLKKAEQRFAAKGTCLALQPSDFITITGDNYGGMHDVIIDSMLIKRDLSIDMVCTQFTDTIENYA